MLKTIFLFLFLLMSFDAILMNWWKKNINGSWLTKFASALLRFSHKWSQSHTNGVAWLIKWTSYCLRIPDGVIVLFHAVLSSIRLILTLTMINMRFAFFGINSNYKIVIHVISARWQVEAINILMESVNLYRLGKIYVKLTTTY